MEPFPKAITRRTFFKTMTGITVVSWTARLLPALPASDGVPELLVLENGMFRAQLDPRTGALVSLLAKATGWRLESQLGLAQSFSMLVPLPNRRDNNVVGMDQARPSVDVSADGHRIAFKWDHVASRFGGIHEIGFTGTVELGEDGLSFGGAVDNRSALTVESVNWPCFGNIMAPAAGEGLEMLGRGYGTMHRDPLLPEIVDTKGYWGTANPTLLNPIRGRFVLIAAKEQGVYCGLHDMEGREYLNLMWQQITGSGPAGAEQEVTASDPGRDTRLELDVSRLPYVAPGEKHALVPFVMAHYSGSWHHGADRFTTWAKSWYRPARAPSWTKDIHSWQQIQINSPEGEFRFPFSDLPVYARDCVRHGVMAIQLVGWNRGGQDGGNPFHDADPQLGGPGALRAAIAECQKLGVKVVLFSKFTWLDRTLPWFRQEGWKHAAKDPYGDAIVDSGYQYYTPSQLADVSTHRFSPACFESAAYRALACGEFEKLLSMGADGMLYDEIQHHGGANLCFDPSHGHHVPAYVYGGDAILADSFRRIADRLNPEFAFTGEEGSDWVANVYGLFYTRIHADHVPWARYLYQDKEIMVAVQGFDDRETVNACLMHRYLMSFEPFNFKGRLDQIPKTMEYARRADDFRRRYRAWLWDEVDVLDTLGASLETDAPHVRYGVLRQRKTGLRAAVVANTGPAGSKAAEATLSFASAPVGSLRVASPDSPDALPTDGRVSIPARGAVVVMEQ